MRKRRYGGRRRAFELVFEDFEDRFTVDGALRNSGRRATRYSARFGAWLVAAGFLVLGIGGGLIAWLRQSQGAGTEQIISALAIAVVGILAAIVHGAGFLAARRAREAEYELDRERDLARQALDRAAELHAQAAAKLGDALSGPGEVPGGRDGMSDPLAGQVERIADYLEADAALLNDLVRAHGHAKVAVAWRQQEAKSQATRQAVQMLNDLIFSAKD